MTDWLAQLFCRHQWRWFSLYDGLEAVHMSQCETCRKIAGGWRDPRSISDPFAPPEGYPYDL